MRRWEHVRLAILVAIAMLLFADGARAQAVYGNDYLQLPAWSLSVPSGVAGGRKPVGPGTIGYNTTTGAPEYYNGSAWNSFAGSSSIISGATPCMECASGGVVETDINSKIVVPTQTMPNGITLPVLPNGIVVPTPANNYALRNTYTKIAAMQTASPAQLYAVVWGDSVGGFHAGNFVAKLKDVLGAGSPAGAMIGCLGTLATGLNPTCVSNNGTSGTVTGITGDFPHFPTGVGFNIASGGCQIFGSSGTSAIANTFDIFYIAEPGAGTISLWTNKNNAGFVQQTSASAANASTIGAVLSATMGDTGPYTFQACASGGAVKIFGGGFVNTTVNGVVVTVIDQGGIALSDMVFTPAAVVNPWYAVFNPNLVTFEMKDDGVTETPPCGTRLACINMFISAWQTANANTDFLLIGSSPVLTGDSTQVSDNVALQTAAVANNAVYWDGYYPGLDYPTELALGWITNGGSPHQTTLGQAAESNLLWSMMGLGSLINSVVTNNVVNNSVVTGTLTAATIAPFNGTRATWSNNGSVLAAYNASAGDFGQLANPSAHNWCFGHGGNANVLGTCVINWTDNGAAFIAPPNGVVMLGSVTPLAGSTGEVGLPKIAPSGSAPGAAGGKFELVCGSGAGSAKLIVYAGTSTTPSTILDNIGSGVTGC